MQCNYVRMSEQKLSMSDSKSFPNEVQDRKPLECMKKSAESAKVQTEVNEAIESPVHGCLNQIARLNVRECLFQLLLVNYL